MTGRVVVVGSANIDVVLRVDQLPTAGQTLLAVGAERGFGGKGANQAVAAAVAGAPVALIGRVGADPDGAAYVDRLARFGIDLSGLVATTGQRTGVAYVVVDERGENLIVVDPGANAAVRTADLADLPALTSADVLLVQCELQPAVVEAAIRLAHGAGARVVLNLAPFVPLPLEVIALAVAVVVNEDEAAQLAAALGAVAAGQLADALLVTRGSGGARWGTLALPALRVDPADVVDTTGAGDAFCGALAAALAAGGDRETALESAVAAGADAVLRVGAQPGLDRR